MAQPIAVVVGDIGGTNARLQLFSYLANDSASSALINDTFRRTYRTSIFTGLAGILRKFLDDISKELHENEICQAIVTKK